LKDLQFGAILSLSPGDVIAAWGCGRCLWRANAVAGRARMCRFRCARALAYR
jgi:hypothetical protein